MLMLCSLNNASSQDSTLISFDLQDQFGNHQTKEKYLQSPVVVIGSDRAGSKYNEVWGAALRNSLKDSANYKAIKFLGVADVRGVPAIFTKFVTHNFPKDRTILMDWDGVFSTAYDLKPKYTNILVFSSKGKLLGRYYCQEIDDNILAKIEKQILGALNAPKK